MTDEPIRILLVEDEPAHAELVRRAFETRGDRVQLQIAESLSEARERLAPPAVLPHLIISDWRLPDGEGMELLSSGGARLTVPVMIMTSHGNERVAVDALKAGALDYVVKSETTLLDMPHLAERVLREWEVRVERERMQQALRDSEGRFRLLAENATDVISRHDLRGAVLYVSPSCHAVLGYEPADLIGLSWMDLVHPDDRTTVTSAPVGTADRIVPFTLSFRICRQDGAYIWLESIGRGIRNATTGALEEIHVSSRDITERKRSEEKFYRVFHFSPVAMIIGRLPDMHFMDLNGAFLKMTGYARDEVVGRTPSDLNLWADEDDRARVAALLQPATQIKEIDVKYRMRTGEIGVGLLSFEPIEFGGVPCVLGAYHDITARQHAEMALRVSEEKFNKAFRSSPAAIAISDTTSRHYLDVNDAFVQMMGYTREELLGHTARDVHLWVDLTERERVLSLMQQQGFVRDLEVHFQNKPGEVRVALMSVETVDLNGAPCLLTTLYDTTERRRAEDALRESEQKFRTIIEQSTEGFVLIDTGGQVLEWNQAQVRISGIPREEAVEHFIWEVQLRMVAAERRTPEVQARLQAVTLAALRTGESPLFDQALEAIVEKPDGERRIIQQSTFPVRSEVGLRLGSMASDITERKRSEKALRQYAERLAILHEIDQAILAAKSIEDIGDAALSRIHRFVPSWRAEVMLFDFEADAATVAAAYCDGQKASVRERLALSTLGAASNLKAGQLYVVDDLAQLATPAPREQHLRAAGTRSRVDAPLMVLGAQIGVLGLEAKQPEAFQGESLEVVREVADQLAVAIQNARLLERTQRHAKELEQRVAERTRELAAANERLTELDRLKSKFVSDVSHELRTPIANLKLHVELLEHGRPEKHDHYLTVVKQQARRLGQLVDDILNLSRLEMGKLRVVFGPVDLNFVVEQIVAAHQPRAESSGLVLSFVPLVDLQPVRGEVNQLAQVVTNLVINALNYTLAGSVRVTMSQSETEACLQIEDTGIGIDPDDLPNIFDRFYRGRGSQRSETPGTGLGLAIVKEIIDLHEGRIEVTSQVKQGTTFKVWLPLSLVSRAG
jgi:PAS domain S-box-containing protein